MEFIEIWRSYPSGLIPKDWGDVLHYIWFRLHCYVDPGLESSDTFLKKKEVNRDGSLKLSATNKDLEI